MDRGYAAEPARAPYRALLIASVIAIGCIGLMALAFTAPIDPDCFEWCGLGRYIATAGISLVSFLWLIVFIVLGWRVRSRRSAFPVISCLAAACGVAHMPGAMLNPSGDSGRIALGLLLVGGNVAAAVLVGKRAAASAGVPRA